MWDKILKFLNDNKDALEFFFGSGIILAAFGGLITLGRWLIKEYRLHRIRTNENFPFKIIPPNSNVAKEILGGADDDLLVDRNIPYQQRIQGKNIRRELEEVIEDHRWILITGRTGLGKTREAVQLAQSLNNEGWTVLYLTREGWLDAPSRLPNNVPERKLLFFLDDLNKKCLSSKAEIRPDAKESLTLPIYEPFQARLQRTLEAFDTFCGKSETKVIATARNERTTGYDEPSEWDKLGWTRYNSLWTKFKLVDLPEPDKTAEQKLLTETAGKLNIVIKSDELPNLVERNDGTFRNLVENLTSAKIEGSELSLENFRDTLKGTWRKRYQKTIQKHPEAKDIYDAIELIRNIGISITFSNILSVAGKITEKNIVDQIKFKWNCFFALRELIRDENILNPRDGQIEAKGYRVRTEKYLAKLFFEIGRENYSKESILDQFNYFYGWILITPKSFFLREKLSMIQKIYGVFGIPGSALNNIGLAYANFGFPLHALILYRKSLELKKWDIITLLDRQRRANAWNGLGRSHYQLKQYDDSISDYKKAIKLNPKDAYPWKGLGNVYRDLKQYEDALGTYQKAIELDPKDAASWNNLGIVYRELDHYEEAIQAYQKVIELDPKEAGAWYNLGIVYRDLNRYEEAIQAYQKVIELDPKEAGAWYNLGILYSIQKLDENALAAYRKASELKPDDGTVHSSITGTLKKLGRNSEFIEEEKFTRTLMEKEDEYTRACFEAICGHIEESMRLLRIALEQKQITPGWARSDPDFDFIREDPRFKELVRSE